MTTATDIQHTASQLATAVSHQQMMLSEKVGALKATAFYRKMITVSEIKMMAEIKESKEYKGLQLFDVDGNSRQVSTWEDFCLSLGVSRQKADEDIKNLSMLGEDFLETSQRMGVGYRDLRKLRKLPDDERDIIINGEAVQAEDKDSLIDLIEEISAKHAKTKAELEQQVQDLTADNVAKDKVMQAKNKKIDELDTKLSLRKDPAQAHLHAQAVEQHITDEMQQASSAVLTAIGSFNTAMLTLKQQASDDAPHLLEKIGNDIGFVYNRIAELAVTEGIDIDLSELVTPSWMNDISDDAE